MIDLLVTRKQINAPVSVIVDLNSLYCQNIMWVNYRPQRSCEDYVFTRVCHSVHGGGGGIPACIVGGIPACLAARGCAIPACLAVGVVPAPGGLLGGGVWRSPRKQTASIADGTHPTGMHSC